MRYIFIIQGEGRGHLTQALSLSHILRSAGHSVEQVIVGRCKNREIPKFFAEKIDAPTTLVDSPTFDYGQSGKRGRVIKTIVQNTTPAKLNKWRKSIAKIYNIINKTEVDAIINFYEPLLGITNMLYTIDKPIICIGHQFMIDHAKFAHRENREASSLILRFTNAVCAFGATQRLALSFYPMSRDRAHNIEVVPPLLRPEIYDIEPTAGDFTLGYMLNPAYLSEVIEWKSRNPEAKIHLFWDKQGAEELEERMPNLWLHRINDTEFLRLMGQCRGYITTAGFESVCEALYLGKPALMIPAHIEQQINAADAASVGAGSIANEFNVSLIDEAIKSYYADNGAFREWVNSAPEIMLNALTNI